MTHDVLRQRLLRSIEALPDAQVYQVLDYIEFLEAKYGDAEKLPPTSPLQKLGEGLEDRLRRRSVSPNTIREAFQFISAADRVISGVSAAGRRVLNDLGQDAEGDRQDDEGVGRSHRRSRTGREDASEASGGRDSGTGARDDGG